MYSGELDCVLLLAGRVTYAGSCCPRPFSRGQAQSSHGPRKALWDPASITSLSPPVLLLFPFLAPSSHADHFSILRHAGHAATFALAAPSSDGPYPRHPHGSLPSLLHVWLSDPLNKTCRLRAPSDRLLPPLPPASLSPLACAILLFCS